MAYYQGDPVFGALAVAGGRLAAKAIGRAIGRKAPAIAIAGGAIQAFAGRGGGRTSDRAEKATFFGGECPPGKVLRRIKGGRDICIKRPRMNPANPKALRKAMRRAKGFAKLARKFMYLQGPPKPKGKTLRFKRAK